MMNHKIKMGISACLLGHSVRYDGGHQLDQYLRDTLGRYFEYVPVCPEVECGLGIPREALRLVGAPESPRLKTSRSGEDITDKMTTWSQQRLLAMEKEDLCGFIFKSRSPSSGMERVKVYQEKGMPVKSGKGIFAGMFMAHFPLMPVEEDGRLHDPRLRENFIERVFALRRWRTVLDEPRRMGNLVDFHTREKLLIFSHSEKHYRTMGKLVAGEKGAKPEERFTAYENIFMEALKLKTTNKKNTNVLQHIMGYFKVQLSPDEKQEMLEIIQQYKDAHVPLIVPVILLRHYVRKYNELYLAEQTYLNPHPLELQLRNHV